MTTPVRRSTRQRAEIRAAVEGSEEFLSAQDIYARLRAGGSGVGLTTVYRGLQLLAEDGALDALRTDSGETLYRSCESPVHHHHLVCRECGRTVEVEGPEVETWAARVAAEHGYAAVSHEVEVFGLCPEHAGGDGAA